MTSPPDRLRALARIAAWDQHERARALDELFHPARQFEFETCPYSDCVLVREAPLVFDWRERVGRIIDHASRLGADRVKQAVIDLLYEFDAWDLKHRGEAPPQEQTDAGELLLNLSDANDRWNKIALGIAHTDSAPPLNSGSVPSETGGAISSVPNEGDSGHQVAPADSPQEQTYPVTGRAYEEALLSAMNEERWQDAAYILLAKVSSLYGVIPAYAQASNHELQPGGLSGDSPSPLSPLGSKPSVPKGEDSGHPVAPADSLPALLAELEALSQRDNYMTLADDLSGILPRLRAFLAQQDKPSKSIQNLDKVAANPALRKSGWDGYYAAPLDDRAVGAARHFLLDYAWWAVPTGDGGIQLERHDSGCAMELSWDETGRLDDVFAKKAGEPEDAEVVQLRADLLQCQQENEQHHVGWMNLATLLKNGGMTDSSFIYGQVEACIRLQHEAEAALTACQQERDTQRARAERWSLELTALRTQIHQTTPIDALYAARLARWIGCIETFGPNINDWTSERFFVRDLREMADGLRRIATTSP